jgi:hypothetical protein
MDVVPEPLPLHAVRYSAAQAGFAVSADTPQPRLCGQSTRGGGTRGSDGKGAVTRNGALRKRLADQCSPDEPHCDHDGVIRRSGALLLLLRGPVKGTPSAWCAINTRSSIYRIMRAEIGGVIEGAPVWRFDLTAGSRLHAHCLNRRRAKSPRPRYRASNGHQFLPCAPWSELF